jgi:glycosyltransferase involved in cell wall biosynthesis
MHIFIKELIMEKVNFYKESWISAAVLCLPERIDNKLSKGVLIINQVDSLLKRYPVLKNLFYIVERHGWFGANEATMADIVLLEDQSVADRVKEISPNSVHLDIGPADFIDQDTFCPIDEPITHDIIQVSCWSRRKRIELFIKAAANLPKLSFVHLGHFENSGSADELEYRRECLALAKVVAPNIHFPFEHCNHNDGFPNTKLEVNRWINRCRLGVLTTMSEGINRFKMECFSANRPCLVPSDVAWTTQKHINSMTGKLFKPNVDSLIVAINSSLKNIDQFSPRDYILKNTGKKNSLPKLKNALADICSREKTLFRYENIDWDGRNESLLWGHSAIDLLNIIIRNHQYLTDIERTEGITV